MSDTKLVKAAFALVKAMEKTVDENLPNEIAKIVKFSSRGAAISGLGSAWIPGVGGSAAVVISAGFIWSMYVRINRAIELPFSENIIKSVASGVATNLAAGVVGSIAISTVLSFVPGIGSIGASAIMGGTCYALTMASGYVYLKILTKIFNAKKEASFSTSETSSSTSEASSMTSDEFVNLAKTVIENEDIKSVIKEAKEEYKVAKESGEIKKEDEELAHT